jgi:hypothetical protein
MFKLIMGCNIKFICLSILAFGSISMYGCHTSKKANFKDGFIQIFNGKNFDNRIGDTTTYWHVEDSSLVGIVTPATRPAHAGSFSQHPVEKAYNNIVLYIYCTLRTCSI